VQGFPRLAALTTLKLSDSFWYLTEDTQKDFIAFLSLSRPRCLDFWGNVIADKGAKSLPGYKYLANLAALGLGRYKIRDESTLALIDSPYLSKLKRIDLRDNLKLKVSTTKRLQARFCDAQVDTLEDLDE